MSTTKLTGRENLTTYAFWLEPDPNHNGLDPQHCTLKWIILPQPATTSYPKSLGAVFGIDSFLMLARSGSEFEFSAGPGFT
jgi:hypothetical protein